jgi:hypothetical protein
LMTSGRPGSPLTGPGSPPAIPRSPNHPARGLPPGSRILGRPGVSLPEPERAELRVIDGALAPARATSGTRQQPVEGDGCGTGLFAP